MEKVVSVHVADLFGRRRVWDTGGPVVQLVVATGLVLDEVVSLAVGKRRLAIEVLLLLLLVGWW